MNDKKVSVRKKILFVLAILLAFFVMRYIFIAASIFSHYEVVAPAATAATPCPTTDTVIGDAEYETAPKTSNVAAIAAANALLIPRATVLAGLARNDYQCPNPSCQNKQLGAVTATPDPGYPTASRMNLFAIFASAFDLFQTSYWSGNMEYSWSATITCR